jgi:hypothetical protein
MYWSVPLCMLQLPVEVLISNKFSDLSLLRWLLFRQYGDVGGGGVGSAVRKNLLHWALEAPYDTVF